MSKVNKYKGMPNGAKGKYETLNIRKKLMAVRGWAAMGLNDKLIAEKLDVSQQTILNWKNNHPEFEAALFRDRSQIEGELVNSAIKQSLGFYYTETTAVKLKKEWYDQMGKKNTDERIEIVEVEKYAKPNGFMTQFMVQTFMPGDFKNIEFSGVVIGKLEDYFGSEKKEIKKGAEIYEVDSDTDNREKEELMGGEQEEE